MTHTSRYTDSFTGSDNTTLETHDANWLRILDAAGYSGITSNKLNLLFANVVGTAFRQNSATYSDDQYAQATIGGFVGGTGAVLVRASSDTGANRDYYEYRYTGNTSACALNKVLNGTTTALDTTAVTWVAGDVMCLEVIGTTLVVYQNGIARVTVTGQTDLTTGKPGLLIAGGSAHQFTLDDWEGGDATVGGPVTVGLSGSAGTTGSGTQAPVFSIGL